jgi:hypothetical protein
MPSYDSKNLLRKSTELRNSLNKMVLNSPSGKSPSKNNMMMGDLGQEELINFLENKLENFEQNMAKK